MMSDVFLGDFDESSVESREYIISLINVVYGFHREKRESMGTIPKMCFFRCCLGSYRAIQEIKPQTCEVGIPRAQQPISSNQLDHPICTGSTNSNPQPCPSMDWFCWENLNRKPGFLHVFTIKYRGFPV